MPPLQNLPSPLFSREGNKSAEIAHSITRGPKTEIKERLPGVYAGGTTNTIHFVMSFVENIGRLRRSDRGEAPRLG